MPFRKAYENVIDEYSEKELPFNFHERRNAA